MLVAGTNGDQVPDPSRSSNVVSFLYTLLYNELEKVF